MLITAALTAAGALSSMAQVYSANIVGYINLNIPFGYSLIANQLNNSPDNTLNTLFKTAPDGTTIFKYDPVLGYGQDNIFGNVWQSGGFTTMNPGEGALIYAPSGFTATFVGEVQLQSTLSVVEGYSIVSSVIPQAGHLSDPNVPAGQHGQANTDLGLAGPNGLGIGQAGYTVFKFDNVLGYGQSFWDGGSWGVAGDPGPSLNVGESYLSYNPFGNGAVTWPRSFQVGPP